MNDPHAWLLFTGAALATALVAVPLHGWLLRRRVMDYPESRRSHTAPTPRGGGLACVAALLLAWLAWPGAWSGWWQLIMVVVFMAAVGWLEDRHQLPALWRLLAQVAVAVALLAAVGGLTTIRIFGFAVDAWWLWTTLAAVAVVWLINVYNFMDGSDGMAAGQGLWAGLVTAWLFASAGQLQLAAFSLAAAGAWGGFLVWNRPPARLFMGDAGALALGALMAGCAVLGAASGSISVWVSFMVSGLFVVDATATLLARAVRGEQWYTAHRQHAYQRLLDLGWSHGGVVGLYMLINVFVVLPVIAAASRWPHLDTVLATGLAVLLAVGWWVVQSAATANNDKARS